jgi:hypothetical protein
VETGVPRQGPQRRTHWTAPTVLAALVVGSLLFGLAAITFPQILGAALPWTMTSDLASLRNDHAERVWDSSSSAHRHSISRDGFRSAVASDPFMSRHDRWSYFEPPSFDGSRFFYDGFYARTWVTLWVGQEAKDYEVDYVFEGLRWRFRGMWLKGGGT